MPPPKKNNEGCLIEEHEVRFISKSYWQRRKKHIKKNPKAKGRG
jgi:hypothetical protein